VQPEARPVGEGRYTIVDHEGHSHLAYALEHPQQPGEAQRAMQIEPEASRALRAATRELGIDLDPEDERIHDADLFTDLRIRPGELPTEPLRTGKLD
jgi:hypothetical protein